MGPRLAVRVLSATRELEKIVSKNMEAGAGNIIGAGNGVLGPGEGDGDVSMADGTMSKSWIVIPGHGGGEDWEMIDCS